MKGVFHRLGNRFEVLPAWARKRRKRIWAGFFLLIVAAIPGALQFHMDLSDEQFFHSSDEVRQAYDHFRAQFGSDDTLYLVYKAKDGDVFSHASLKAVHDLEEALLNYRLKLAPGQTSPLNHMVGITSIVNAPYLEPSDNALISRPFVGNRIPTDQAELATLRATALHHPDYPNAYVSPDGKYGALVIRTDFRAPKPAADSFDAGGGFDVTAVQDQQVQHEARDLDMSSPTMQEYDAFYQAIAAVFKQQAYQSALAFYPVGQAASNSFVLNHLLPQINFWMMMSLVIIVIIQWLLFRSLSALVWPLVIIGLSALFTLATLGYLGLEMNMMINIVVLLIMALGVADSIHLLSGYVFYRQQGHPHDEAIAATFRKSGLGVTLTSLTTGLGMLSLLFVPLIPIQLFGFASALGVLFAFVLSVIMLPLMLELWGPLPKRELKSDKLHLIQRLLQRSEHLSIGKPKRTIVVFSIVTLVLLYGALQVRVDSNFIKLFKEGTPIRMANEVVEKEMGGTMSLEIMLSSEHDNAMLNPHLLNAMDRFQHWLSTDLGDVVTKTNSLVNIIKDSNRALNGGRQSAYRIPQDPQVLRQTLFLFDNANPSLRARLVSDNYRQSHITVVFRNQGTREYMKLLDKIQHRIDQDFAPLQASDPSLNIIPTGSLTIAVRLVNYLSWSQINGFGAALLTISLVLFLTFRSFRVGLIALFPNLLPIVTVFGIMGYAGIPLDTDTLLVAPVLIGIVVDDTIHFLTHYRALMEEEDNIDAAILRSFREVGQAIVFTSLILVGAFICFTFLDHNGLRHFGMLASLAMLTALAGDLILLPALLKATRTRFRKEPAPTQAVAG